MALQSAVTWESGEQLLAVVTDPHGRFVVATDRDLLLQASDDEVERIAYDSVDHAAYDDDCLRLSCRLADGSQRRLRIPLPDPGDLPRVVRERVTSTIVISQHVVLCDDGSGVLIAARRRLGSPGVRWQVLFDNGMPTDAWAGHAAEVARREMARNAGLEA